MLERLNQPYVLLFVSMFMVAVVRAASNRYSKSYVQNRADGALFTLATALVTLPVIAFFILGDGFKGVSLFTLLWSVLFGLFTFLNSYTNVRALTMGPLALTSIIVSGSGIIPALYGQWFLGEEITVWQIIGMALMLVSVFFSVEREPEKRKVGFKWLLYTLAGFFLNGLVGVCQKVHRASEHAAEINEYLFLTFVFVFLFTGAYMLILRWKGIRRTVRLFAVKPREGEEGETEAKERGKKARIILLLFVLGGLATGVTNVFNLYLSGAFDAAVFFPVMNGGSVLTTLLLSFVVFREKFTGRRALSLLFGVLALLFLFGIVEMALRAVGIPV